ncbi:MAG TPA: NCS2 family permease [Actinomycetota bacterium]|nr:NCS2 family permease [Actinomycetota bacterium]
MAQTSQGQTVRVPDAPGPGGLDGYFKITERGSTVRTEILAGITTWLTMAYILFLNPAILGAIPDNTGTSLAFPQVLTVTALAAGVMTLAMGIAGKYPFAIAAGLGLNAFVAFTLVGSLGLTWPTAMGVIVIEGVVISILVLTGLRQAIMDAIPMDLKLAIGIGIGLFLAIIGFVNGGIVVAGTGTVVTINPDLTTLRILVFLVTLALTGALVARNVRGAILIGIAFGTLVAMVINIGWGDKHIWDAAGEGIAQLPSSITATPDFALVGNFDFDVFKVLSFWTAIAAIVSVMLSDFFDTMGTAVGLGKEAELLDEEGRLPGMKRVLFVDGIAAAVGGAVSSSSNTTYIESGAGIGDGGRTGLTAVVVGVLFLLAMFFSPIAGIVPPEATAPALIIVAYFMMKSVGDIDWRDAAIGIPALLTITLMPFTYSITNGVAAGFVSYSLIKLMQGKGREVHLLTYLVSLLFIGYFVRGLLA